MSDELFTAIDQHDINLVAKLLAEGADPNNHHTQPPEWRPLGAAIEEIEFGGAVEIVQLLLKHGADVNAPYINSKLTPLHAAMFVENLEVLELLLKAGADPNALSDEDRSPLRFAVERDNLEMAALFLQYGAAKTINDSGGFCGYTALGLATRKLNIRMIELLLSAGADPDTTDSDGQTARDCLPARDNLNSEVWNTINELLYFNRRNQ